MLFKHKSHRFKGWMLKGLAEKNNADEATLAIPEFHTGKVKHEDKPEPPTDSICYDYVAIPEIHIQKKK